MLISDWSSVVCSSELLEWWNPALAVINADGAKFDTFRCREKRSGGQMLVAGQQKLYMKAALSLEGVKKEAQKTQASVTQLQNTLPKPEGEAQTQIGTASRRTGAVQYV